MKSITIRVIIFTLFISSCALAKSKTYPKDKRILEARVISLLKQSNVDIRKEVEKVYTLGDIYYSEKNYSKALYYYGEALKSDGWNLEYQMKTARLLYKLERDDEAITKAQLVYDYSENESFIEQAESLLVELNHPVANNSDTKEKSPCRIALISLGETNKYLIEEIAQEISCILGVTYFIEDSINPGLGRVDRPYSQRYIKGIYENMQEKLPDADFKKYRIEADTSITTLHKYENQKKFVSVVLKNVLSEEEFKEFKSRLSESEQRGQYNASRLLNVVEKNLSLLKHTHATGYVGITSQDIYSNDFNFLFGTAKSPYGVVSYHRFTADFNNSIPDRKKLVDRTVKQLISSSFFVMQIPRCSNPTCARAYPNCLEEHDRKENKPCNACLQKWKQAVDKISD